MALPSRFSLLQLVGAVLPVAVAVLVCFAISVPFYGSWEAPKTTLQLPIRIKVSFTALG